MRNKVSAVSDPNIFVSESGDKFHIIYSPELLYDGSIKLSPKDKVDIQKEIDSHREETDMSYILARLKGGDSSVLARDVALFGDFTDSPKSLADAMQLAIDGEVAFNRLPKSVRAHFDFNFRKWIMTAGSKKWIESMDSLLNPPVEPVSANSVPVEDVKKE